MKKLHNNTDLQEIIESSLRQDWRVGIVYSSFYLEEIALLVQGAQGFLQTMGVQENQIALHPVSGSFEIPLIGAALAERKAVDGLIGLGIIIEGETHHADLLASETARGMMDVQVRYRMPFAFEVLYVKSLEQARERAQAKENKGEEAARAVLHSLVQLQTIRT